MPNLPPMSGCEREGIAGNCGPDCRVLLKGGCENGEMLAEVATHCDRCGFELPLKIRIMSWFTEEVICLDCIDEEQGIRDELVRKGYPDNASRDCGHVPNPAELADEGSHEVR
jgi:hypothetical protein